MIFISFALLVIGFVLLIKGADLLVDGASSLAKRLGLSDIVIGLTVVSFGTSAPELVVNLFSAAQGTVDLAIGNIVGSNIVNTLLILGVAAAIYPLHVKEGTVWKEIPLALLASFGLFFVLNDSLIDQAPLSVLSRIDGFMLLLLFGIFLYYTYGISRVSGEAAEKTVPRSLWLSGGLIALGLIGLIGGGQLIVRHAVSIASTLGMSEALIGLTIVAIGTSLPELATSAVAAYRKKADIAVGNVVGSNIFNILFVLAVTGAIRPLPFTATLNLDVTVMLLAATALFLAMFVGKKHQLERWQGLSFIGAYGAYIGMLIWRG